MSGLGASAGGAVGISVLICSWNVGNAQPPSNLSPWIPAHGVIDDPAAEPARAFDLIVVGVQECSYKAGAAPPPDDAASESDDEDAEPEDSCEAVPGARNKALAAAEMAAEMAAEKAAEKAAETAAAAAEQAAAGKAPRGGGPKRRGSSGKTKVPIGCSGTAFRRVGHFVSAVQSHLGGARRYVLLELVELMEMRLLVFAAAAVAPLVRDVESAKSACGLGRVLGNKGGLVCSLRLRGTSLCFTSCHLAAHEKAQFVARRNADVRQVHVEAVVGNRKLDLASQFHHSFFLGDLNYRIDLGINDRGADLAVAGGAGLVNEGGEGAGWGGGGGAGGGEWGSKEERWQEVARRVEGGRFDMLLRCDQLLQQQREGAVLAGWTDLPPRFRPTFKVKRGSVAEQYTRQRTPSYCDRILHRSLPAHARDLTVAAPGLASCPELVTSDHKPVRAAFEVRAARSYTPLFNPARCPEIWVTGLRARGCKAMDVAGTSDPYVKFCSDPPNLLHCERTGKVAPATKVRRRTLNPTWKNHKVPVLSVASSSRAELAASHLILAVLDYDRHSSDDPMGYVIVPLSRLLEAEGGVLQLEEEEIVHHSSTGAGTLSCTLQLVWPVGGVRPSAAKDDLDARMAEALREVLCRSLFPLLPSGQAPTEQEAQAKFAGLDVNGDGAVVPSEIELVCGGGGGSSAASSPPAAAAACAGFTVAEMVANVFECADDGEEVTQEDFVAFLCGSFSFAAECKTLRKFLLRQVFRVKRKKGAAGSSAASKQKRRFRPKKGGCSNSPASPSPSPSPRPPPTPPPPLCLAAGERQQQQQQQQLSDEVLGMWDRDDPDALDVLKIRGLFREVDQDGNGLLDGGEFAAVAERLGFEGMSESEMELCMGMFDANGDGYVSVDEFIQFLCSGTASGGVEERTVPSEREQMLIRKYLLGSVFKVTSANQLDEGLVERAFLRADADGSGAISQEEFRGVVSALGFDSVTEYELQMFVSIFDRDGDGEVDYAEFSAFFFEDKQRIWTAFEVDGAEKRWQLLELVEQADGHEHLTACMRSFYEQHKERDKARRVDSLVLRHYLNKL